MKPPSALLASFYLLVLGTASGHAQARGINGNGFDSGEIKIIPNSDPAKKVTKTIKTIQLVAVSPERVWKSSDKKQKPIIGSLLAFEREAKSGKVSIIRDEKVRLLIGKKDFTLPLAKLSLDDQAYIQNLEDSARIAGKLLEPAARKKPNGSKNDGRSKSKEASAEAAEK